MTVMHSVMRSVTRAPMRGITAGLFGGAAFLLDASLAATAGDNALLGFTRASVGKVWDNAGVLQSAANDVIRQDHNPADNSLRGWLLEEARTNEIVQSEDVTTTWTVVGTPVLTANSTVAPDGTTTADTIEDDDGAATESIKSATATAANSQTWSASVYVLKDAVVAATRFPVLRINFTGGTVTSLDVSLDTSDGSTASKVNAGSGTVVAAGAEDAGLFWRLFLTATNDASGNVLVAAEYLPAAGANADLATYGVAATGSNIVWGFQLELGGVPTSYIKTTTVAVTRAADLPVVSDVTWLNLLAGAFVFEYEVPFAASLQDAQQTMYSSTGNNAHITRASDGDQIMRHQYAVGGFYTAQSGLGGGAVSAAGKHKVGYSYDSLSGRFSINGSAAGAIPSGVSGSNMTSFRLGQNIAGTQQLNGWIRKMKYFDTKLSDSDLVGETT